MDDYGFIKIHRKILKNWVYDKSDYLKIWLTMIIKANHCTAKKNTGGQEITLERGDFIFGRTEWAKELDVSEAILRTFIKLAMQPNEENESMIAQKLRTAKCTVYHIVNYDKYHSIVQADNQQDNHVQPAEQSLFEDDSHQQNDQLNEEEKLILKTLKEIPNYPFDYDKDLKNIRELMIDYPKVDMAEEVKKYATWLLDAPLKPNSRPRSQLRNWCSNVKQYQAKNKSLTTKLKKQDESGSNAPIR